MDGTCRAHLRFVPPGVRMPSQHSGGSKRTSSPRAVHANGGAMPLRDWRQPQRRHTAVQRVHRLRLLRDSGPVGAPAPRPQRTSESGGRADRPTPFTPETTELLRLSFTRIATGGASPDDLSDVL